MKKIRILIIFGASGVGKTDLVKALLKHFPELLRFSISATTRDPGEGEIHGEHYFFFSEEEFSQMVERDEFLETNPFVTGRRYGTLRSELEKAIAEDKILVLDLEFNGAKKIYEQYPEETIPIFIDAKEEVVIKRLEQSSTRKRDRIPERIANLRTHRELVKDCNFVPHCIDSSEMDQDFVFNRVANILHTEIKFRKSAYIGGPSVAI